MIVVIAGTARRAQQAREHPQPNIATEASGEHASASMRVHDRARQDCARIEVCPPAELVRCAG
jgi:hypothetical protein